ncbi:hypothetical protein JYU34_000707 [Plutella xylostella]|uniref:Uncharacterized protein n=1 Tax=Plutella xylostella TaxID=51655 RepID=A0ABQ7R8M5_PLUXY|nr:hypothetical protein JYU34_000707 [Plutella xylostella]
MLANFTFGTWESVCFVKICGVTIESHPASSEPLAAGQPGHAAIDYDYPGTDSGIDSRPVLRIPASVGLRACVRSTRIACTHKTPPFRGART